MSETALEAALREAGVPCSVEARDTLAIVTMDAAASPFAVDETLRRRALALAREHGFTHLALELLDAEDRAALPRD